jgi:hypothetical protein
MGLNLILREVTWGSYKATLGFGSQASRAYVKSLVGRSLLAMSLPLDNNLSCENS